MSSDSPNLLPRKKARIEESTSVNAEKAINACLEKKDDSENHKETNIEDSEAKEKQCEDNSEANKYTEKRKQTEENTHFELERFNINRMKDITGDNEFQKELAELFINSCLDGLPLLEKALFNRQQKESILYSHDIKGSSSNIGVEVVHSISEKIEKLSRENKFEEAIQLLPDLRSEIKEIKSIFKTIYDLNT